MGRRKIEIEFIREDRSRATTFIKRKSGLFKKAHELAILTGAQVAVVVFSQQDRLFTYSNEPCSDICTRYLRTGDAYEAKGPLDYGATQDNEDDSDEDNVAPDTASRRGSIAPQRARSSSLAAQATQASSPLLQPRKNSNPQSPRTVSPSKTTPLQQQGEFGTRPSPTLSSRKRPQSPLQEHANDSPKHVKHEAVSSVMSDVRSSPHQIPRSQMSRSGMSTPPVVHSHGFSLPTPHMSAPMVAPRPPPPLQMYSQNHNTADHIQQHHTQQGQQLYHQQNPPHSQQQYQQVQQRRQSQVEHQNQQQQGSSLPVMYQTTSQHSTSQENSPQYTPAQSTSSRQLPMAPPLTIPPSNTVPLSHDQSLQGASNHEGREEARSGQPLLPHNLVNSGQSRVLLPGESTGSGLTPIESPGNFASSLYTSQGGISEIGTNISIPRISTDVGSLFYNWNTNEPGLSPATSMMLNQFRDNPDNLNPPAAPSQQVGPPGRGPPTGPPISAGVLENFSPITAQWLSGHGIPPPTTQTDGSRPYQ